MSSPPCDPSDPIEAELADLACDYGDFDGDLGGGDGDSWLLCRVDFLAMRCLNVY